MEMPPPPCLYQTHQSTRPPMVAGVAPSARRRAGDAIRFGARQGSRGLRWVVVS